MVHRGSVGRNHHYPFGNDIFSSLPINYHYFLKQRSPHSVWLLVTEVLVSCTLETLLFLTPPTREKRILRNFFDSRIFYGWLYVLWMYRKAFSPFPHIITLTYILIFFKHKKTTPALFAILHLIVYILFSERSFLPAKKKKKKTRAIEHYSNSATFFLCVRKFILLLIFSNYTHNFHGTSVTTPPPLGAWWRWSFFILCFYLRALSLSYSRPRARSSGSIIPLFKIVSPLLTSAFHPITLFSLLKLNSERLLKRGKKTLLHV